MMHQILSRDRSKKKRSSSDSKQPRKGKDWYTVDAILASRVDKGHLEIEIKWEGYTETTWENFEMFCKDSPRDIEKYLIKQVIGPYQRMLEAKNEQESQLKELRKDFDRVNRELDHANYKKQRD